MMKIRTFLKNRIFKHCKTTLAGLIIILVSLIFVWFSKATFTEVATFLLLGLGLIGMRDPKTKDILRVLIIALLFTGLVGCSAKYRLKKLLKYHPELLQKDTLFFRDSIFTQSIKFDTIFKSNFENFKIEKEKFSIELFKKDSFIYLNYSTPADTFFIEKKILVSKIVYPPAGKTNIWMILALTFGGLIAFIVLINIVRLR